MEVAALDAFNMTMEQISDLKLLLAIAVMVAPLLGLAAGAMQYLLENLIDKIGVLMEDKIRRDEEDATNRNRDDKGRKRHKD